MWNKPFKPPLIKPVPGTSEPPIKHEASEYSTQPATKKRRLIHIVDDGLVSSRSLPTNSPAVNEHRKPLVSIRNTGVAAQAAAQNDDESEGYYTVLWYICSP